MGTCECEKTSQSLHPSPGRVSDEEDLLRLAFLPDMVDDAGNLKNTAIPSAELTRQVDNEAPERGMSVFRRVHLQPDTLLATAKSLIKKGRMDALVFRCTAGQLRTIVGVDKERGVCVVDRAKIDDTSHAEAWGGKAGRSPAAIKDLRDQIVSKLKFDQRLEIGS